MDLLGSILGTMSAPPAMSEQEKARRKKQKEMDKKAEEKQKEQTKIFRTKTESQIQKFVQSPTESTLSFPPMAKWARAILHDVAEVAGLVAHSFGEEEVDRHTRVWKKEHTPSEDELNCLRRGDEWDPVAHAHAKEEQEREQREAGATASARKRKADEKSFVPAKGNYRAKYEHLIGKDSAKEGARSMELGNRSFGMVSAESKKDRRTVEDIQKELREKKKRQKLQEEEDQQQGEAS